MSGAPFLFGKLPAHGDFVGRGLSDTAREGWDDWGAAALAAFRQVAGDAFEDAHGVAAPWRFVVSEAAGWTAGALAPSIDSVGRRFLIALGVGGLSGAVAGACGLALAGAAEGLIYDALSRGLSADEVLAAAQTSFSDIELDAQAAATFLAAAPSGPGVWWTLGSEASPPLALAAGTAPSDLLVRGAAFASIGRVDLMEVP